ncbi:hypothetical protein AVEN_177876-1 [Araneus ventricosus]|uniref:HAT C-terminal dimerisation domain-containing protein n=1 Tax=Araneus ventricosus TaxID=182803 RepID=A0A4Y2UNT3_ARAVE|nr:hypothetical protein AVEN_177876-1 [Araneus ventricosus]
MGKCDLKLETTAETLKEYGNSFFPTVAFLLQLFRTIPMMTSRAEKSLSTIKHFKTYLRSSIGQTRFNGVAFVNNPKNRKVNVGYSIDIFYKNNSWRLAATNWQSCEEGETF